MHLLQFGFFLSFNEAESLFQGLKEDDVAIRMLKDMSILKHYVNKDNIEAIKEDHPALLCAIGQITLQMTSDIETLAAIQSVFRLVISPSFCSYTNS